MKIHKSRTQVLNPDKKSQSKEKSNLSESKPKKSKKIKQKCVNAFNDYYYDHFIQLSQKAASQRQVFSQIIPLRNIASAIKKISISNSIIRASKFNSRYR